MNHNKVRHRCAICEWVDPSGDIAPTAICCKYDHAPIKNIGAFTSCYGFELDIDAIPDYSNLTIKDLIDSTPIRMKCPVCNKVFGDDANGTPFVATELFDHFHEEHKDKDMNDYIPIKMELIRK